MNNVIKFFFWRTASILLVVLLFVSPSIAQETVRIPLYPQSGPQNNPVYLDCNGKVYSDSWWFDEVAATKFAASADEQFMLRVVSANQTGAAQDILNLWPPDERTEMSPSVSNLELFSANRSFFSDVKYSAFMSKILYGSYTIFFIQHTGTVNGNVIMEYPVVQLNGSYYLTNQLKNDPVFVYLSTKYSDTIPFKTRRTLASIALTPADPSISVGSTQQFTATGMYSDQTTQDLTNQAAWSSSDAGVAIISNATGSNGSATALSPGTTMIGATFENISGTTALTVTR